MKLLALETSADACSVALWLDGEIAAVYEEQPRRHVELILPMVRGLLADAGLTMPALDGIAFGAGPGSFTGVRIAVSAAQGFGLAAGLPLVAVSSLAALAARALADDAQRVYVAQDARMGEVYAGAYAAGRPDGEGLQTLVADGLTAPGDVNPADGDWWLAGGGWERYPEMIPAAGRDTGYRFPRAREVAVLAAPRFAAGDTLSPRDAEPAYLRRTVARQAP